MNTVIEYMSVILQKKGLRVANSDFDRPWGGFFVIEEDQADEFINEFFVGVTADDLRIGGKLSPKILLVKPGQRLSWQYHHRRAEIWRVVEGEVAVMCSSNDEPGQTVILKEGHQITLSCGERHRLIGLDNWGIVAEIWQHTQPNHPSDEADIVRLQDDFGR
ncbi:MAG: phosphoheptose isomerase [Sphingobacteriaceae bacterium]|nr:phosphoheptose isomerase [Sphingobacteriaceae bacterium]